jgi:hypothetical protein
MNDERRARITRILGFSPSTLSEAVPFLLSRRAVLCGPEDTTRSTTGDFPGLLAELDNVLIPLLVEKLGSEEASPLDSFLPPVSVYDVLITDIKDSSFLDIARALNCTRLSPAPNPESFPVTGTFYGPSRRIFVPLIVRCGRRDAINVLFLVDTGAPMTFLRSDTLEALGFKESPPECANVTVHGQRLAVGLSHGHFAQVDLLGQDFFVQLGGTTMIDYGELTCLINAPTSSAR